MKRKSQKFPGTKPKKVVQWTLRVDTRQSQRRELSERWLSEDPYTAYRYNVETCDDGKRVYLLRPTYLNKGFDFQVNLEGFKSVTRKPRGQTIEMPSHKDVVDDLQRKLKAHPTLRNELLDAISKIYDCGEPDDALESHPSLRAVNEGLQIDKLLRIIKWLFIEQDLTYWLGTGRNMLMSGIEEDAFGIASDLYE